jgi:hypothetical protein
MDPREARCGEQGGACTREEAEARVSGKKTKKKSGTSVEAEGTVNGTSRDDDKRRRTRSAADARRFTGRQYRINYAGTRLRNRDAVEFGAQRARDGRTARHPRGGTADPGQVDVDYRSGAAGTRRVGRRLAVPQSILVSADEVIE